MNLNKLSIEIYHDFKSEGVWKKRLSQFVDSEFSMKKFQLIYAISLATIVLSLGLMIFSLLLNQIVADWFFVSLSAIAVISTVVFLINMPLVKLSENHRNELSKLFFEEYLNIEFYDGYIQLRDRRSSRVVHQLKYHE
ncbi:hypothetical protein [Paraglaciecola chathamensis]|jgi:hypothetical protein|uniref:Uncharacterized protein n=1 Tax=Paraglaciecola chathamensis TaxID=368405 RepID=A0A8H9M4N2_9ALTE|nr:hypothetical protein [Paraglaciecola oceanifecundans]GGZ71508.1 hypothetical protein GCM10011274_32400 [Paraglaciecola oceanifecundans]